MATKLAHMKASINSKTVGVRQMMDQAAQKPNLGGNDAGEETSCWMASAAPRRGS